MQDERRIRELKTLKTIAEKLNQGSELASLLPEVLKELIGLADMQTGWIFLVDAEGNQRLAADYHLPEALAFDHKKAMCGESCWCMDRFRTGRLQQAANILNCRRIEDSEEHEYGDTGGITHHATVPLAAGGERFGVLNVAAPGKTHFSEDELALLESTALQIGSAIKRIQLAEDGQRLALEAERGRLAQDLHDSVNQLLFSISLTAGGMKEMVEEPHLKEMLLYMQELSGKALDEMKELIWQLRPAGLEKGLMCALKQYGEMLQLELECVSEGVQNLPPKLEEALLRIGQEALNNCVKHSGLQQARLTITRTADSVQLMIEDHGSGFISTDDPEELGSLGLKGMKERAARLGGTFLIRSKPGKGTIVQVCIPVKGAIKR
ncbi:GAF domain-containing protein [Bacillus mangrovi]|uniref:histidine kinase n=1 Tax=Metabacillus mangrovi TaxID=1491830 RepID=A0A7X2V4I7_9BACI|nr:GAF domain-containing sensor histidine kinase [Metabacillus mangrovi]MTH53430.1 GAF domain-containing protein [Metabacillus mangrovi]